MPEHFKSQLTAFNTAEIEKKSSKNRAPTIDEKKKELIISHIKGNRQLWERILKFENVEIKEIKELLFKKDIIVEMELLKEFLSSKGVLYQSFNH